MEGERKEGKEGKKGERKGRRRKRSWGKRRPRCFQTGQGQMFQVVTRAVFTYALVRRN